MRKSALPFFIGAAIVYGVIFLVSAANLSSAFEARAQAVEAITTSSQNLTSR